jgi:Flp pilus assembly protein protease CpaA
LLTAILLCYTAIRDLQERAVEGYIWLILLIAAIPLNLLRLFLYWGDWTLLTLALISIILGISIAIFMAIFGLWGGADVFALISLSTISPLPLYVLKDNNAAIGSTLLLQIFPISLSIVINAALLQIPLPFILAIRNGVRYTKNPLLYIEPDESRFKKLFACFLGGPSSLFDIIQKHPWFYQVLEKSPITQMSPLSDTYYPVPFIRYASESLYRWQLLRRSWWSIAIPQVHYSKIFPLSKKIMERNYKWKFDFQIGLKSEEEDLYRQRTTLLEAQSTRKSLWIQYSIPFLVPLTIGYLLAFFWGNFIITIIGLL